MSTYPDYSARYALTVRELIAELSKVEDQDRGVVIAGSGAPRMKVIGANTPGHVVLWPVDELHAAERDAGMIFF